MSVTKNYSSYIRPELDTTFFFKLGQGLHTCGLPSGMRQTRCLVAVHNDEAVCLAPDSVVFRIHLYHLTGWEG